MFSQIITAAQDLLRARMTSAVKLITGGHTLAPKRPNVRAYIGAVGIEPHGQEAVYLRPQLNMLLEFKSLKDEAKRIEGVGLMAEAVIAALSFQDLGLDIDELMPVGVRDVTTREEDASGTIKFLVTFQTGFVLEKMEDEDAAGLMTVGLSYYLQEPRDDGVADVEDVVDIPQ